LTNSAFVVFQLLQIILFKTCIFYGICTDTTNWFCGSLVFLVFCKWLHLWTSLSTPIQTRLLRLKLSNWNRILTAEQAC